MLSALSPWFFLFFEICCSSILPAQVPFLSTPSFTSTIKETGSSCECKVDFHFFPQIVCHHFHFPPLSPKTPFSLFDTLRRENSFVVMKPAPPKKNWGFPTLPRTKTPSPSILWGFLQNKASPNIIGDYSPNFCSLPFSPFLRHFSAPLSSVHFPNVPPAPKPPPLTAPFASHPLPI